MSHNISFTTDMRLIINIKIRPVNKPLFTKCPGNDIFLSCMPGIIVIAVFWYGVFYLLLQNTL